MKKTILTFILNCSALLALCQQPKENKWSFSVGSGLAMPLGGFAATAPENTAIRYSNGAEFLGFQREGNSAAKTGFSFGFTAAYQLSRPFKVSASFVKTVNVVNTQPATDYLLKTLLSPTDLVATDYEVTSGIIGIDYCFRVGWFSIETGPRFGFSYLTFPEYTLIAIGLPSATMLHYGKKPDSNSMLLGIGTNVNYLFGQRFFIGAGVSYLTSDFAYAIDFRVSGRAKVEPDKITYRVLSVNVNLGYRF